MIDQDKMRALREFSERLRTQDTLTKHMCFTEEADAIDLLLAEVEAIRKENDSLMSALAECREAMPNRDSCIDEMMQAVGDPGSVPLYVRAVVATLRAELEAAAADKRAAKKPDAMTKAVKQLADWLLTDPNEGNPLCFAGPPEPFVLGLSRVKMRSIAGDEWTLIAGLQEGWLNAEQRAANFWRIAKLEREEVAREEAVAQYKEIRARAAIPTGWMLVPKHRGTKPLAELIIAASLACVENRLLDDDDRHELAQFADQLQHIEKNNE